MKDAQFEVGNLMLVVEVEVKKLNHPIQDHIVVENLTLIFCAILKRTELIYQISKLGQKFGSDFFHNTLASNCKKQSDAFKFWTIQKFRLKESILLWYFSRSSKFWQHCTCKGELFYRSKNAKSQQYSSPTFDFFTKGKCRIVNNQ